MRSQISRAGRSLYTHRPSSRCVRRLPRAAPATARRDAPVASAARPATARMNSSVTADRHVEVVPAALRVLRLDEFEQVGMIASSTPICAPRREPALSTVRQDASNTSI